MPQEQEQGPGPGPEQDPSKKQAVHADGSNLTISDFENANDYPELTSFDNSTPQAQPKPTSDVKSKRQNITSQMFQKPTMQAQDAALLNQKKQAQSSTGDTVLSPVQPQNPVAGQGSTPTQGSTSPSSSKSTGPTAEGDEGNQQKFGFEAGNVNQGLSVAEQMLAWLEWGAWSFQPLAAAGRGFVQTGLSLASGVGNVGIAGAALGTLAVLAPLTAADYLTRKFAPETSLALSLSKNDTFRLKQVNGFLWKTCKESSVVGVGEILRFPGNLTADIINVPVYTAMYFHHKAGGLAVARSEQAIFTRRIDDFLGIPSNRLPVSQKHKFDKAFYEENQNSDMPSWYRVQANKYHGAGSSVEDVTHANSALYAADALVRRNVPPVYSAAEKLAALNEKYVDAQLEFKNPATSEARQEKLKLIKAKLLVDIEKQTKILEGKMDLLRKQVTDIGGKVGDYLPDLQEIVKEIGMAKLIGQGSSPELTAYLNARYEFKSDGSDKNYNAARDLLNSIDKSSIEKYEIKYSGELNGAKEFQIGMNTDIAKNLSKSIDARINKIGALKGKKLKAEIKLLEKEQKQFNECLITLQKLAGTVDAQLVGVNKLAVEILQKNDPSIKVSANQVLPEPAASTQQPAASTQQPAAPQPAAPQPAAPQPAAPQPAAPQPATAILAKQKRANSITSSLSALSKNGNTLRSRQSRSSTTGSFTPSHIARRRSCSSLLSIAQVSVTSDSDVSHGRGRSLSM